MKMNTKKTLLATSITASILALTACGGGGSGDKGSVSNVQMSGAVVDGFTAYSKIWVDVNGNKKRDNDEPWAYTDAQGYFSNRPKTDTTEAINYCADVRETGKYKYCLEVPSDAKANGYQICSAGGRDQLTGKNYAGNMCLSLEEANTGLFVSPMSTMVNRLNETSLAALISYFGLTNITTTQFKTKMSQLNTFDKDAASVAALFADNTSNRALTNLKIFKFAFQAHKIAESLSVQMADAMNKQLAAKYQITDKSIFVPQAFDAIADYINGANTDFIGNVNFITITRPASSTIGAIGSTKPTFTFTPAITYTGLGIFQSGAINSSDPLLESTAAKDIVSNFVIAVSNFIKGFADEPKTTIVKEERVMALGLHVLFRAYFTKYKLTYGDMADAYGEALYNLVGDASAKASSNLSAMNNSLNDVLSTANSGQPIDKKAFVGELVTETTKAAGLTNTTPSNMATNATNLLGNNTLNVKTTDFQQLEGTVKSNAVISATTTFSANPDIPLTDTTTPAYIGSEDAGNKVFIFFTDDKAGDGIKKGGMGFCVIDKKVTNAENAYQFITGAYEVDADKKYMLFFNALGQDILLKSLAPATSYVGDTGSECSASDVTSCISVTYKDLTGSNASDKYVTSFFGSKTLASDKIVKDVPANFTVDGNFCKSLVSDNQGLTTISNSN